MPALQGKVLQPKELIQLFTSLFKGLIAKDTRGLRDLLERNWSNDLSAKQSTAVTSWPALPKCCKCTACCLADFTVLLLQSLHYRSPFSRDVTLCSLCMSCIKQATTAQNQHAPMHIWEDTQSLASKMCHVKPI